MYYLKKTLQQFQLEECFMCHEMTTVIKLKRAHTCKRCGVCVCSKCSLNKIKLFHNFLENPDFNTQVPHRLCNFCYKDFEFCSNYISKNDLKWNTNSATYHQWLEYIQKTNYSESQKLQRNLKYNGRDDIMLYQDCLTLAQNTELMINDFEAIRKDVCQGRSDANTFNLSVREFIAQIQVGHAVTEIRDSILRLLYATVAYNPQLGYCQGMNYLAAFLLCFCDEVGAFVLLTHLFDHILPDRFFQGGSKGTSLIGFLAEQHFLKQIIQQKFDTKYVESLVQFTDFYASQFLLTLMTSPFSASCLIITWSEMFKRNTFYPMSQAFLFTLEKSQQYLMEQGQVVQGMIDLVCRSVDHESLKANLEHKIYFFSRFERRMYLEQFFAHTSRRWVTNDQQILFRLKKITKFSIEEIIPLQTEFKTFCVDANADQRKPTRRVSQVVLDQKYQGETHNLTDSDEEISLLQVDQIHAFKQFKYGIMKESFLSLMMAFHCNYRNTKERTMIDFDAKTYEEIFDIFDEHHSGLLDFREFLTCFSVLLRGSFQQKLELFFSAFGTTQQKYLNNQEFTTLINSIVNSYISSLEHDADLQDQCKKFLSALQVKYQANDMISYAEVMSLTNDKFILDLEDLKEQKSYMRRGTCVAMVQCLEGEKTRGSPNFQDNSEL